MQRKKQLYEPHYKKWDIHSHPPHYKLTKLLQQDAVMTQLNKDTHVLWTCAFFGSKTESNRVSSISVGDQDNKLVSLGVLKSCSDSEWADPTLIIPRRNGTVTFVSDFRKLNEMLKRKPYTIPKNAQMLQELEEFDYATSFDLNMGYDIIRLNPDAQKVCTIVTHFGKYQYLRLPMGISCSPYIFQENMSNLMQHLNFIITYLDDISVILCSTFEDHLEKNGMCSKNII
jgi:hypothetical protein